MARLIAAAFIICGRAPIMVKILIIKSYKILAHTRGIKKLFKTHYRFALKMGFFLCTLLVANPVERP
jgi:hypothetical protein